MKLSRQYSTGVFLMLALSLVGCSGIPVSTDYDTSRQFPQLSTYAWMVPKQKLVEDPTVDNDLMNNRVMRAVDAELFGMGVEKATGDASADFLITYHVSAENRQSINSFHSSYGYYPCWQSCYRFGAHNDTYIRHRWNAMPTLMKLCLLFWPSFLQGAALLEIRELGLINKIGLQQGLNFSTIRRL